MVWIVYFRRGASLDGKAESVKKHGAPVLLSQSELENAVKGGRLQGDCSVEANYFHTASHGEVIRWFGGEAVQSAALLAAESRRQAPPAGAP